MIEQQLPPQDVRHSEVWLEGERVLQMGPAAADIARENVRAAGGVLGSRALQTGRLRAQPAIAARFGRDVHEAGVEGVCAAKPER